MIEDLIQNTDDHSGVLSSLKISLSMMSHLGLQLDIKEILHSMWVIHPEIVQTAVTNDIDYEIIPDKATALI